MSVTPLLSTPLRQHLHAIMTCWHWLVGMIRDSYQPERHYMRGPGPKWLAKRRKHRA
jgi:hypothetical protein